MHLRGISSSLVVSAAALGTVTAVAAPAGAADVAPAVYHIASVARPGTCLTASQEVRSTARLGDCQGADWRFAPAREGEGYDIRQVGSEACLGMSPIRVYPPIVWTDDCDAPWRHSWRVDHVDEGVVQLRANGMGDYCLAAQYDRAELRPCDSGPETFWRLEPQD